MSVVYVDCCVFVIMLSAVMLSVVLSECQYAEWTYAQSHHTECLYVGSLR